MEKLGSKVTDFYGILRLIIFRKSVEKIQFLLTSDKNNVYFTWRPYAFFIISRSIVRGMRNVSDQFFGENQIKYTRIAINNPLFGPENRTVHEIMWKNIVEPYRLQMTI